MVTLSFPISTYPKSRKLDMPLYRENNMIKCLQIEMTNPCDED